MNKQTYFIEIVDVETQAKYSFKTKANNRHDALEIALDKYSSELGVPVDQLEASIVKVK